MVQGGLATVGLVLAYTTWQREPERAAGEVVIMEATRNEVERIHYDDGTRTADVERGRGGAEPALWIKVGPGPQGKPPARTMRGNEAAEKLMNEFAPLRGARALGALDKAKLKELGFETSKKKIEVTARGQKRTFAVAGAGFGSSYLKDERDGRVYVSAGTVVSDLDAASSRLVDRLLHEFKPQEFDQVTIVHGAKRRELVTAQPTSPTVPRLSPKANPGKVDDRASNWHEKLWRLFPVDVLGKDELPAGGRPEVALRIEYGWKKQSKGWVELARIVPAPPSAAMSTPEAQAPKNAELYARSEHTVSWVKLPGSADDILKEAEKVVAGE
jgi:hypothetical protein